MLVTEDSVTYYFSVGFLLPIWTLSRFILKNHYSPLIMKKVIEQKTF